MNTTKYPEKLFNSQKYRVYVRLYNPDGYELILNPEAIMHMVIQDDLHFWPTRGFLVYENTNEIIERKFVSDQEIETSQLDAKTRADLKAFKPYVFRNDGRDYLDISIMPLGDMAGKDLTIKTLSEKDWELKYTFVIYDKEDIPANDFSKKVKKFYFWDKDYQTMLETKIQWSTATSAFNEAKRSLGSDYKPSLATDDERKMPTGSAIKAILDENGFKTTTDMDKFDKGSTRVLYTAFNDTNIWDSISYLNDNHISEKTTGSQPLDEMDICILNKDRYTNEFELTPVYKIFDKAGNSPDLPKEYQLEHLYFEDSGKGGTHSPNKAPVLREVSTTNDIKIAKIKTYQYVDMSSGDSTNVLATTPVHSYDFKNKTFSINMADSNITKLEQKMGDMYIQNKLLTKNGEHPMLTLNKNKTNNMNINPVYSPRSDRPAIIKRGVGKLLYAGLFLNGCIMIQLDGASIRKCGRFVGIDRNTTSDNKLDYKLCGQWFVTNVSHVFFNSSYTNEITAVKMHSYDDLQLKTDVD
jgi:hypothetical protein